jgi:hypothetical protein
LFFTTGTVSYNAYIVFMFEASLVTTEDELLQIHHLSQANLKQNLSAETRRSEGFVTWLYSIDLLKKMHQIAPSVIVKDGEQVVAYALTTLKESMAFHPDLEIMFQSLASVQYAGKPLSQYRFYCMGQICVAQDYRGKGTVPMLYKKHKQTYSSRYDFILTEISTSNERSMKAHQNKGFQTIYTYTDAMDEWNVVIWDWN